MMTKQQQKLSMLRKLDLEFLNLLLFLFKSTHDLDLLTSSQICVLSHYALLKSFTKNQFLEENTSSHFQVW